MNIQSGMLNGRKVWTLDNDALTLGMTQGGGHIASLTLNHGPAVNPFWVPVWKTVEPWRYRAADAKRYDSKLLATICGHNLCLGWFGEPSEEEAKAGMPCHGEAPVSRWALRKKSVTARKASLTCGCELPVAQMAFERTLSTSKGSLVIGVKEKIRNLSKRDLPYTMCQHVTVGPPFLEKGVTVFDMPATKGHTFPGAFGDPQRLRPDTAFTWPKGPGRRGRKVDMRTIAAKDKVSSDFSTQLMDPAREDAWFAAVNPKLGVLLAYVWKRSDYPWIGNWEENYGRKGKPWAGKSLTRGMEFANTPFPIGLRNAVTMGTFQGEPTYGWLPARGTVTFEYSIVMMAVPDTVKGVRNIEPDPKGFVFDMIA